MADGENEGLWGDITNENLEILGRAAGGVGGIALAGTSHTLTVAQGALSEGQYSTLVLGGSPTGTNTITIQPNTITRTYLVQNNSGQDAVFTQGSGGNVTVPNGGTAIVFCSGTGASSSVTDITADFLRGGNNLSDIADAPTALQNLGLTATAAEINLLDGATLDLAAVTATANELNTLDGFTGAAADLNYAKDLRATGVTTAEFETLDGLTASTADLNTLTGAANSNDGIPQGGIIMWSGSVSNIPAGWALCNGANGTPDLRNRFVVGAGGSYSVGSTGGADSVTLSTSQMPSHTHSVSGSTNTTGAHTHSVSGSTNTTGAHTHTVTTTGGLSGDQGGAGASNAGDITRTTSTAGDHSHSISGTAGSNGNHSHSISGTAAATGGGSAHENRPPFYALAYIQKL